MILVKQLLRPFKRSSVGDYFNTVNKIKKNREGIKKKKPSSYIFFYYFKRSEKYLKQKTSKMAWNFLQKLLLHKKKVNKIESHDVLCNFIISCFIKCNRFRENNTKDVNKE